MKIGNTELKHGLMLAPMAGVTDRTFRRLCRENGAEYTVSEMVSAKALCYEQRSKRKEYSISASAELATVLAEDTPTAVQIFGSEPEFMAEAAAMLQDGSYKGCVSTARPTAIDINMGCPVKKITSNGEGSALMKDIDKMGRIAQAVCKAVDIPVTVKIRAGWDRAHVNAPEAARVLEEAGVSAICVHARTRDQFYMPGIDLSVIAKVKEAVSIPVIGNGDVFTGADALHMISETGCDGVMVGRGATGNPWIFTEIAYALEGKSFTPPTCEERLAFAQRQLYLMLEEHGERRGMAEAKKHMAWYVSGMRGCAAAKTRIMTAETPEGITRVFGELLLEQNEE